MIKCKPKGKTRFPNAHETNKKQTNKIIIIKKKKSHDSHTSGDEHLHSHPLHLPKQEHTRNTEF